MKRRKFLTLAGIFGGSILYSLGLHGCVAKTTAESAHGVSPYAVRANGRKAPTAFSYQDF